MEYDRPPNEFDLNDKQYVEYCAGHQYAAPRQHAALDYAWTQPRIGFSEGRSGGQNFMTPLDHDGEPKHKFMPFWNRETIKAIIPVHPKPWERDASYVDYPARDMIDRDCRRGDAKLLAYDKCTCPTGPWKTFMCTNMVNFQTSQMKWKESH